MLRHFKLNTLQKKKIDGHCCVLFVLCCVLCVWCVVVCCIVLGCVELCGVVLCVLVEVCLSKCCSVHGSAQQENNHFKHHGAADNQ